MLKYSDQKYDELATEYEGRWPEYLSTTHDKTIELLQPEEGETILDAAAGTGALTQLIVSAVGEEGEVYLAEISPGMRAVARERFHRHPSVQIDSADVHKLDYGDDTFDRIACANAFHYFDEPDVVLSEFARVLKPGGRLAIVDWSNDRNYFRVYDACMQFLSRAHNKSYTTDEMAELLNSQDFDINTSESWRFKLWSLMGFATTLQP